MAKDRPCAKSEIYFAPTSTGGIPAALKVEQGIEETLTVVYELGSTVIRRKNRRDIQAQQIFIKLEPEE